MFQFEKSAQLVTIWWGIGSEKSSGFKGDDNSSKRRDNVRLSDVLYSHQKYLNPSVLIDSQNVALNGTSNLDTHFSTIYPFEFRFLLMVP